MVFKNKILIVGAGPAGASPATIIDDTGFKVDLNDKRPHLAGNCYDEFDEHGVLIHKYH